MQKVRIGFCFNSRPDDVAAVGSLIDADSWKTIEGIEEGLKKVAASVIRIPTDNTTFDRLKELKGKIDLVFNISEGISGDARESQIPIFCEILGIAYTHSSPTTHAITLNKQLAKLAVVGMGFRCPQAVVIEGDKVAGKSKLEFPIIIKPNGEGSSSGVFATNVVDTWAEVKDRVAQLRKMGVEGKLLVEEYIDGREFTVAVVGNPLRVLPIIEQRFDFLPVGMKKIAGYELKWIYEDKLTDLTQAYTCPADLTVGQAVEIGRTTLGICAGLGIRDCARIDYRMDARGRVYFLEINSLPGIIPQTDVISYFPLAARISGLSYEELIGEIIGSARSRYGI